MMRIVLDILAAAQVLTAVRRKPGRLVGMGVAMGVRIAGVVLRIAGVVGRLAGMGVVMRVRHVRVAQPIVVSAVIGVLRLAVGRAV